MLSRMLSRMLDEISCTIPSRMPSEKLNERTQALYRRFGISGGHPPEPPVRANASFKTGPPHHSYPRGLVTAPNIYFIRVVAYFGLLHHSSAILFFVGSWSKSVERWKEDLALIILCQFAGLYIGHRDCRLSSQNCTASINYQAAEACRGLQNVSSSKADKRKTANTMMTCLTCL